MTDEQEKTRPGRSGSACWVPGAGWASRSAGRSTPPTTWSWWRAIDQGDELSDGADARAEVVVDFTTPDVVMDNLRWCVDQGMHAVVGTTGFTDAAARAGARLAGRRGPTWAWSIAPNFGIGAVLMMQFAARAARHFESVEIIEQHHPRKLDAPERHRHPHRPADRGGPRRGRPRRRCRTPPRTRCRGARGADIDGVRVHAVRATGLVAHQEVLFGTAGRR